jgi:3-deoxy-D-manno-octulosonic-acid transferase
LDPQVRTFLYQFFGGLAAVPAYAFMTLKGRFGTRWADRLGFPLAGGQNPLWFHAASVGEAQSALTVIRSVADILPLTRYVLSVGTPAGLKRAEDLIGSEPGIQLMAPPLDFFGAPGRSLDRVGPRALIIVETEIWPELIGQAYKREIPVMVVAGRMSQKSYQRYMKVRSFLKPLMEKLSLVAAVSPEARERFLDLGTPFNKTVCLGNPKFDSLRPANLDTALTIERPLGRKIIVAGSTEGREEDLIVSAWREQGGPKPFLLLAPRHLGRVPAILDSIKSQGLPVRLYSENRNFNWPEEPDIIIIDELGLLARLYALADLALIGGSFYRGQGHNPLEPAVFGCPIVFGPYMSSFREQALELETVGAAKTVLPSELSGTLARWLARREAFLAGLAGRELLAARPAVGPGLAALIGQTLSP